MKIVDAILDYLKRKESDTPIESPDGVCPNCWGRQEYDNKIKDLVKDKQVDVNNHSAKHAFIQDFVVNHVDGIVLKRQRDTFVCPSCNTQISQS